MFDNINIIKNNDNTTTYSGFFGISFLKTITTQTNKRINYITKSISNTEITVYDFFNIEFFHILDYFISNPCSKYTFYGINVKTLHTILEHLKQNIDIETDNRIFDVNEIKNKMNFDILEHQKIVFKEYPNKAMRCGVRGILLDVATGGGKTFISLAAAESLHAKRIIILCPLPTVNDPWRNSLENTIYKHPVNGWYSTDNNDYNDEKYVVIHYDYLSKALNMIKYLKTENTVVIVDESHNFGDMKSSRTNTIIEFVNKLDPSNVIMMSGTPIKAIKTELIPILHLLDKRFEKFLEKRFINFYRGSKVNYILQERYKKYSVSVKKDDIELPDLITQYLSIKLKNGDRYTLENIAKNSKEYYVNRTKELEDNYDIYLERYNRIINLVIDKLPEKEYKEYVKNFKKIKVLYSKNQLMQYTDLMRDVNRFEDKTIIPLLDSKNKVIFREAKTIVKYIRYKVQGEVLSNIVLKTRIECYSEIAENIEYRNIIESSNKKTLIFSNYINVCESCKRKVIKQKYNPVTVYGDSIKDLTTNINKLSNDDKINPLIATYKSLSTGVPITAANIIIPLDMPYRRYIYEQAIARAWRLGQDTTVTVYIPELNTGNKKNIADRNIDIMEYFKNMVEDITGNKSEVVIDKRNLKIDNIVSDIIPNSTYDILLSDTYEKIKFLKKKITLW